MAISTKKRRVWIRWAIGVLSLFVIVSLLRLFVIEVCRIGGDAMAPNIKPGEVVWVFKAGQVKPGDAVLFRLPKEPGGKEKAGIAKRTSLAGRVVAAPGDRLYTRRGDFWINGRPLGLPSSLEKSYAETDAPHYEVVLPEKGDTLQLTKENIIPLAPLIKACEQERATFAQGQLFLDGEPSPTYVFTEDCFWILSDNALAGPDSRHLGVIARKDLIGRIIQLGL